MAELLLKVGTVGPDPLYQDGDIVCAFNQKRIKHVHAQHICHIKNFGFNIFKLRAADTLAKVYHEKIYKYKFERISAREIRRTNLDTLEEEIFSNVPNSKGEYIHVKDFINHQKRSNNHKIFGTAGNEFWYGGTRTPTDSALIDIWTEIESRTAYREINFPNWPLSKTELKNFRAIKVDDFDDVEAGVLVSAETSGKDDEIVIVKKRKHFVSWRTLPSLTSVSDIENKDIIIDTRDSESFTRSLTVGTK